LTTATFPLLYFDHIAKTEHDYDHCYVEVSIDGGLSYMPFMIPEYLGFGNYVAPQANNPEGDCFTESAYPEWGSGIINVPDNSWWKQEVFDLRNYLGQPNLMLRFRLKADSSMQRYGWLIDNVRVQESPPYDFYVNMPPGGFLLAGGSLDYVVTLQNKGAQTDSYSVNLGGTGALTYTLLEMDGINPLPASISIPPWTTHQFLMRVADPGGVSHLAIDNECLNVMSNATGTILSFPQSTTYLLGDTVSQPIVISALPFTDSFTTIHYNHDHGPYGAASGLVNLLNPITGYYSATGTLGSSPDVVYQLTLSQPTLLSIDLAGSGYDTAVALVTAPGTAPGDVLLINEDFYADYTSYVNSGCNYVPAGTYYIVVGGYSNDSGNYTLNVASATPPVQPTVTIQYDPAANQVTLNWTQNTAMRYDIYSDTSPFGSFSTTVATNLNAGTCTISPIPSPMMYYKVVEKFCYSYPSKDNLIPIDPVKKE
ncbi:MAG: hypothetical protein LHW57_01945, partial [Candidatus Cloacimonetes bacterium]|nr:hypothetical protein [Candidatus Cloacimonadota bacterium]